MPPVKIRALVDKSGLEHVGPGDALPSKDEVCDTAHVSIADWSTDCDGKSIDKHKEECPGKDVAESSLEFP